MFAIRILYRLLLLRAGDDPSANFYSYVSVDRFFNVSHLEDACFALDVEILYGDQVTHFIIVKYLILTFFQDCTHFLCSLLIIN